MHADNSHRPANAGGRFRTDILRIAATRLPLAVAFFASLVLLFVGMDAGAQQPTADTRLQIATASAGPADLRMTGPTAGEIGKPVSITVSGLPAVDLGQSVGDQTKWIDSLRFDVSGPAGAVALDKELSMSVSPWEWRLRLTLTPASAGVYVVVCDWNQEPYGLALHRVSVGGTVTPPITPPVITDPTTPATATTGPAYLVVIRRSEDLTADQAATLLRLRAWADNQPQLASLLEISPESGADDPRLAGYIGKAGPLPWLVLSRAKKDGSGAAVLWSASLPQSDAIVRSKVEEVCK